MDPAGEFATSGSNVLNIECSHEVFDIFYFWIYTGRLKDAPALEPPTVIAAKAYYPKMKALYDTWIFADRRGILMLGNTVIDTLHERLAGSGIHAMPVNMEYLYANTEPVKSTRLRPRMVRAHCQLPRLDDLRKPHQANRRVPRRGVSAHGKPSLGGTSGRPGRRNAG
jgi:hypothetical protein